MMYVTGRSGLRIRVKFTRELMLLRSHASSRDAGLSTTEAISKHSVILLNRLGAIGVEPAVSASFVLHGGFRQAGGWFVLI
eukprot:3882792-Rhodomonas_salina.10